jgi:L-ascorbate metabolism protein UlaG (beta-lactamase superfamily)
MTWRRILIIYSIKPHFILLSHGHSDHIADCIAIAENSGAKLFAIGKFMNGSIIVALQHSPDEYRRQMEFWRVYCKMYGGPTFKWSARWQLWR